MNNHTAAFIRRMRSVLRVIYRARAHPLLRELRGHYSGPPRTAEKD